MKRGYCSTFWQIFSYNHINSCCFSYVKFLFSVINILNQFFKKVMYQVKKLILLLQISLVLAILMLLWENIFLKNFSPMNNLKKDLVVKLLLSCFSYKKGERGKFSWIWWILERIWWLFDLYSLFTLPHKKRCSIQIKIF